MVEIVNDGQIKQIEAKYASDEDPIIVIDDKGNVLGFVHYDVEYGKYMIKSGPKTYKSDTYKSISDLVKNIKEAEPNYKFYQGVDLHIKL